ncbi:hypothetical protein [Pseudomonas citronellolis]|uniref:hypothetical protein n=1 Tax=Pseudomonas citronellolis TaxID=53408 RepID=UPI0011C0F472|nr:hypothetical protein [Pseudomonas citronellolis]
MPREYVDAHLGLFNSEGGAFIQPDAWIKGYPSFPDRKFVGLRSEIDDVVNEYRKSGNDVNVLNRRLALGLNEEQLQELAMDRILLVRIQPGDKRFKYDIPNGNERGAYSGQ